MMSPLCNEEGSVLISRLAPVFPTEEKKIGCKGHVTKHRPARFAEVSNCTESAEYRNGKQSSKQWEMP